LALNIFFPEFFYYRLHDKLQKIFSAFLFCAFFVILKTIKYAKHKKTIVQAIFLLFISFRYKNNAMRGGRV